MVLDRYRLARLVEEARSERDAALTPDLEHAWNLFASALERQTPDEESREQARVLAEPLEVFVNELRGVRP